MQAHDFTQYERRHTETGKGFTFGTSPEATARELRDLADRIEQHEVHMQQVRVVTHAKRDDWTYTYLRMVFAEAVIKDSEGRVVKLYGNGHFPIATVDTSVDKSENILSDV